MNNNSIQQSLNGVKNYLSLPSPTNPRTFGTDFDSIVSTGNNVIRGIGTGLDNAASFLGIKYPNIQQNNKSILGTQNPTSQQALIKTSITPTPTPPPSVITPAPQSLIHSEFADILNNRILPITRQYGIPDAMAASQAAHESGYGTSDAAQKNNNFFGLMHFDKNTGTRSIHYFATPEESAHFYGQTVKAIVPNLEQYKTATLSALKALQSGKQKYEGDNPNPMQYVYDVSQNPYWQAYGGGEPLKENPKGWLGAKPATPSAKLKVK